MDNTIKLKKGLTIKLKGEAQQELVRLKGSSVINVCPDNFVGLVPKVVVKEGDKVLVGDPVFVNKRFPDVKVTSPVSGTVKQVVRGDRRKLLAIQIEVEEQQQTKTFDVPELAELTAEKAKEVLLESGLFALITQIPYAVSATPDVEPKAIFVSGFRDMPLASNVETELKGNEKVFQAGLTVLSKIATTHLSVNKQQTLSALTKASDVTLHVIEGKCPAGNATVQANHIDPVNKGEAIWTVDPFVVVFIGRLFTTGKLDLTRTIAIAGSVVTKPSYVQVLPGTPLRDMLQGNLVRTDHVRIINGNPLTGKKSSLDDSLSFMVSEVTVIPEGDNVNEFIGWILPRTKQFSTSRSYVSWLCAKSRKYDIDARIKGGQRHMIMSGEYDSVFPMSIYPEQLVKAIISGDIDKQEQLGIYEIAPEDFAVAEFVDSSKLPLQAIVREGLNTLRKENE